MSCPVCIIAHDPAIHAATLNIRKWHKRQVLDSLKAVKPGQKRKDKKHTDLVVNFANQPVNRRHGYQSTGDGEVRGC